MPYGLGDELRDARAKIEELRSQLAETDELFHRCADEIEESRAVLGQIYLASHSEYSAGLARAHLEKHNAMPK